MSIVLIHQRADLTDFKKLLQNKLPNTKIELLDEVEKPDDVEFAISWKHPHGVFNQFKNLQVIASFGAGVDHIFSDPNLPQHIRITKIVDQQLTKDMCDFVLMQCLNHLRHTATYQRNQTKEEWNAKKYKNPSETQVGILGLGTLGSAVAKTLVSRGFNVAGWSNSEKNILQVKTFSKDELNELLSTSEILVCLLPLTKATRGILNRNLFNALPNKSCLINIARGEHLNEDDLKRALKEEKICAAFLDVFEEEPLPQSHWFWKHKSIHITPHVASVTNPKTVVNQLAENYKRFRDEKSLKFEIDIEKAY
ncbi:2-hydroxyacid dehydrogenase [Psychroflexus salis]|uniref:Glyoxylate/hydroxypyruvate reductase A n=1 Tax=Psychroflexus salis TaxID=1526574 RepID=A0A916ZNG5_9FLAO|nr:glyoxylate/hydroxypyruvate reductase A [Psychroflexus salis]GGE06157.1 glyoxylate/hydroxypyruvate reductase A [Psychroflexus salis]